MYTDSQSALSSLRDGPAAQSSPLGIDIWRTLRIVGAWTLDRPAVGALPLRSQGQRAGQLHRQGGQLSGPHHHSCGRQDRALGRSKTNAHSYHPGPAGRVVPPAYGRAPARARRRRRQADRGRRPPAVDHLYPVATQGRAGALPAVRAVRSVASPRGGGKRGSLPPPQSPIGHPVR